jgi:predicted DsbA family dithiol-disulfide isomerase
MYSKKFGADRAAAIFSRLAAAGESDGIAFKFGGNTGSTRDSHRLLWYAGEEEAKGGAADSASASASGVIGGLQTRVVEQLFRAYFEEEKNITDKSVLLDAAVTAGLDRGEVEKLLGSDLGGEEVDREARDASRRLVTGVPYFSVQGKYSVEGADEPETFLEVFERVKAEE